MKRSTVTLALYYFLGSGVFLSSAGSPPLLAQSAKSSAAQAPTAPDQSGATYVGAETCKTCHEGLYKNWETGVHWKQTYQEGGVARHGCED